MTLGDSPLGAASTLGVHIDGDLSGLRSELNQTTTAIAQFANTSTEALRRAASQVDQASSATARGAGQVAASNKNAAASFEDYQRRAVEAEKQVADAASSSSQKTTSGLASIGSVLGRLTGVAGFALLAKQVWDTGIGFNTFTQNTQVSLTALLGSQAAAKGFLADILAFAKQTPFAFTDLTNQAQRLLSYGIDAKNVIPVLTALGDAAQTMGKGVTGVDQLATAIGQISAKGRLQSDELLQLSEVGVNGLKILANQANMTTADYQKLIEKGLIPADQAIQGIVTGLEQGTTGINGTTTAFGGMMDKIKGSGGITAAMDSSRTAFRNAAGAVTENLVPAYLTFLHTAQQGLGVVQKMAEGFGKLSGPAQSSALALVATTAAVRALNVQARAEGAWSTFKSNLDAARASAASLDREISTARAAAVAARPALLGAFGGPVGLAMTGASVAVAAFVSHMAEAKARVDGFKAALEATLDATGGTTDDTVRQINESLSKVSLPRSFGEWVTGGDKQNIIDFANKAGVATKDLTGYILGESDAVDRVNAALDAYVNRPNTTKDSPLYQGPSDPEAAAHIAKLKAALDEQSKGLTEAQKETARKAEADKDAGVSADQNATAQSKVATAYASAATALRQFTDDEVKAQQAADDTATSAFNSAVALSSMKLDLSTASDVADARDKLKDATNDVRDAEAGLQEVRDRKKHTANDVAKAEDAVTEARKKAKEAADTLADTEARRDPVAQYKKQQAQILADAKAFRDAIKKLGEEGLNATDLLSLANQGPEASKDTISALLKDKSLVDLTNKNRTKLDSYTSDVGQYASIAETALQVPGASSGKAFADAFTLALAQGTSTTIADLAKRLGEDPRQLYDSAHNLGMSWIDGLSDALKYALPEVKINADGSFTTNNGAGRKGYAAGGVLPGYTPGRDVYAFATPLGRIDLSGGEAVMRPEFTRAVGSGWVNSMNAAARSGGVAGVAAAMDRYLGGFAGGGVVPQVVTVPQSVTNTREEPQAFYGNIYVSDPESVRPWASRTRARRNLTGRR